MGWVDNLTGMVSRLENNFKEFDKFYQELIEEHLDPKKPKNDQEDIIDVLLQVGKERGVSTSSPTPFPDYHRWRKLGTF